MRKRLASSSKAVSLDSRQFLIGLALVSVIPLLSIINLFYITFRTDDVPLPVLFLGYILTVVLLGCGVAVLRRFPRSVQRVRAEIDEWFANGVAEGVQRASSGGTASATVALETQVRRLMERLDEVKADASAAATKLDVAKGSVRLARLDATETAVSGIVHDLGNLLGAVLGNSELLKLLVSDNPQAREYIADIEMYGEGAVKFIDNLGISIGRVKPVFERILLANAVNGFAGTLDRIVAGGVRLNFRTKGDSPYVMLDRRLFCIAVGELVRNANDALHQSKGTVTVATGLLHVTSENPLMDYFGNAITEGRYGCVSVHDAGCGIAPGALDRLFDPFFSTKTRAQGLGLAKVLGVVRVHGGAILVDSSMEGAMFKILLRDQSDAESV